MTDLIVPVLVGAAAALLPLAAHWYWQRRRDSIPGVDRSVAEVVRGWARRATPAIPFVTAPPDAFVVPGSLREKSATEPLEGSPVVAAEVGGASSGDAAGQRAPGSAHASRSPRAAPGTPATPAAESGAPRSPESAPGTKGPRSRGARRTQPAPPGKAKGRSTIQLDPLDTPVDGRRARITVGALIDDLELAKLGRRT